MPDNKKQYNPHVSLKERETIVAEWVSGLEGLISQLRGGVARENIEFFSNVAKTRLGTGEPWADAEEVGWGIDTYRTDEWAPILIPLFEDDAYLHSSFHELLGAIRYTEGPKAIFVPIDNITSTWRGILLFHELNHWMTHRRGLYRDEKNGHWIEEYHIYLMEILIVRRLFKKPYADMAYRLSKKFEPALRAHNFILNDRQAVSDATLERIFGPAMSDLERGCQRGVILLDALYRAFDRIYPNGDKTEHYAITRWFYSGKASQ